MATLPARNGGLGPPQNLETRLLVSPKFAFPFKGYILLHSDMGTESIFRALVHDEVGFDYHLRELPFRFARKFRALSSQGRAALEQGDWQTAEMSFLGCKDILLTQFMDHPLVVWVNLFLAQSYQAMGTLQKVMDLWTEIYFCASALILMGDSQLVGVCSAFCSKAQYELGEALGDSSNEKKKAIQDCSFVLGCSDDAAEARICFLLCCDYDRLGRFNDSLRWIRKANRVMMKDSSGWNSCKFYFLEYEARLLMRLQMFSEALKVLCTCGRTRAVHILLHECYTEISRRAADVQQGKVYEELATEQLELMQTVAHGIDHYLPVLGSPLRESMTFHLGSSGLGLARAPRWRGVDLHMRKLPAVYKVLFEDCFAKQRGALEHCVWETATLWSEQMREILKMIRRLLPTESYDWLLSWVDLPLAGLYHYHAGRYDKALIIWEEIQECEARSNSASADTLELNTSKGYQIPFAALEYEMSISNLSPQGKDQIIQKWTRAYCTDEETAERELCFWLYFGYHRHGNYERALKWLQMEKKLRFSEEVRDGLHSSGVCSRKRGRNIDYFCCDYDYNRCEIDLFMKLGRHEEAVAGLERLLNTEQCLHEDGCIIDNEQLVDEGVQGQLPTAKPTATGCILLKQSAWLHSPGVERVIQSPVGLEHHLLKLPFPIQLAFRKHGYLGRLYDLELVDWENAMFQFECCLEILETIPIERNLDFEKAYEWLMVWVMLPLADLFEKVKKQYRMAFDLRVQMLTLIERCVGYADQESMKKVKSYLGYDAFSAVYMCAISDYPSDSDLKRKLIQFFCRMLNVKDERSVIEFDLLTAVRMKFFYVYENIEGALDLVRRERQLMDQRYQKPQERLAMVQYNNCVEVECLCLWYLQRPDEAEEVVNKYWKDTGAEKSDLPGNVRMLFKYIEEKVLLKNLIQAVATGDLPNATSDFELNELRQMSRKCEMNEEYAKAISYREDCVKLIQKNPSLEGLENPNDVRLGYNDTLKIAFLHLCLFHGFVVSQTQPMKGFGGDEDFQLAVKYYKQCLRLLSEGLVFPSFRSDVIAEINMCLAFLYSEQCTKQYGILLKSCREDSFLGMEFGLGPVQAIREHYMSEVKTFLEWLRKLPLPRIGERVVALKTRSLHTLGSKQYTEGWIEWLEAHKVLYTALQSYYAVMAAWLTKYIRMNLPVEETCPPFYTQREVNASWWNAFLFSEGERTRVMMYQYEMHRRKILKPHEVWKWDFDANDRVALRSIKESCRALLDRESAVFVQYSSPLSTSFIYVIMIDQDGCKLFFEYSKPLVWDEGIINYTSSKRPTPKKRLDDLYDYLAYKQQHPDHTEICQDKAYRLRRKKSTITNDESMNKYLEFLYGALIEPIESLLDKVKPGDKLVLAPSELLTRVPFAALRKPGKDQKRLIERYAFTIVPSLRVLQMCSERLQELQNDCRPYTGRCGSIVALGNPTYDCAECERKERKALPATEQEVKKLVELFGDAAVMTLTERDATAKKLLEWAAKPSQESFRQAIVHIGAHGHIDEDDHRNNLLQLACDSSVLMSNASASMSSGEQAKEIDIPSERGKANDEHIEDDCSDGDESDSEVQELAHDDETLNSARALLHRVMSTWSGAELGLMHTNPRATSEASSFASSSNSNATIRRFARGSSTSSHDLTVEVINNLESRWTAELLVLSACQTSAGRRTAEGVLSLTRAFMAAGVPCVVASLWKVDDKETLPLMVDFYDELCKGNDVASALQSATLQCMARCDRNAVQYWAPFNVWGVPSLRIPKELQRKEAPQTSRRRRQQRQQGGASGSIRRECRR